MTDKRYERHRVFYMNNDNQNIEHQDIVRDDQLDIIRKGILHDMSEGVIILRLDGQVEYVNPAASSILDKSPEELTGKKLAALFFDDSKNDQFSQTILNAIYDPETKHREEVLYHTGSECRKLHVMTSSLHYEGEQIGIIIMLGDITEIMNLRQKSLEQVIALLDSVVRALSTAIDERSHYTAHHTRNMVLMGDAFLKWLDITKSPHRFSLEKKQAFLMSVWMHDVGKLAIPLSIMDKATRLGNELERINRRFEKMHLLDRIALLEGRLDLATWEARERQRAEWLSHIDRINTAGFITDQDCALVDEMARQRYQAENGEEKPILSARECECLRIRKGTLTDEERAIMQSHVLATRKILDNVKFPDAYTCVPSWAAKHHELLNGMGYPNHLSGESIPKEVQLLTILDIFEALTARDRPYKKPIPLEKSLGILQSMVDEGAIDGELLEMFRESRAWEALEL